MGVGKKEAGKGSTHHHPTPLQAPKLDAIEQRIAKWEETIEKQEADLRNKDDNKAVALSTSKINCAWGVW